MQFLVQRCKKFTNQILTGAVSNAMVEEVYQSDFNRCSFQCDVGRIFQSDFNGCGLQWDSVEVYQSDFNRCSFKCDGV